MIINISRNMRHQGEIVDFSSENSAMTAVANLLRPTGTWRSASSDAPSPHHVTIDYASEVAINEVVLHAAPDAMDLFPENFRLEASLDGTNWQLLHAEKGFSPTTRDYNLRLPLTILRYLRFFAGLPRQREGKFCVEMAGISAGIAGPKGFIASHQAAEQHSVQALCDDRPESWWEVNTGQPGGRCNLEFDLGAGYNLSSVTLAPAAQDYTAFPERFTIETSSDRRVWMTLVDERQFKSLKGSTYTWDMGSGSARFLRIEMDSDQQGLVRLGSLDINAALREDTHIHAGSNPPQATVFQAGIVRLARDGEDSAGTAVAANDRRLREAGTLFKGIVRFAENGEYADMTAVQASDERLQPATELREGIMRFGYDRENKPGVAVQGNDSRLREATESSFGIVKLCADGMPSELGVVRGSDRRLQEATGNTTGIVRLAADGENTPGTAVQGNDRRLKDATTTAKGIVELAEDGEATAGLAVQAHDRRLKDATTTAKGIVELAEDGEATAGLAVQAHDRRLKDATTTTKGIVELAEDGEDAPGIAVQGNDRRLKDATETTPGIMRFAANGETTAEAAVQGNDRRLKDATTTAKGIVELAEDGETNAGVAVQGNDRRLKDATTTAKGIVELAEDGETNSGVAVQGNDRRLKDATTTAKGIVELAEDGETNQGVVVQGNDRRLKDATEDEPGIVRLATDAGQLSGTAVQGSDSRLRPATEHSVGIMRFARNGERAEHAAVQGNDDRLLDATTLRKGIVELAEDGEAATGVAVQGSDSRLKQSSIEQSGIVRLARHNEKKSLTAVQADDPRLEDAREALPHTHEYAPLIHELNDHSGPLSVSGSAQAPMAGLTPPSAASALIHTRNTSTEDDAIGISGTCHHGVDKVSRSYGVLGHAPFVGVRGQAPGHSGQNRGCGVLGISRFGAGGVFSSEHDYALVADGSGSIQDYDSSAHLIGEGKGLLVRGSSFFDGKVELANNDPQQHPANFVEMFEVDDEEYISPGDILVISDKRDRLLCRTHRPYNRAVAGIVAGNPVLVMNNLGFEVRGYPVVLAGQTMCKIDARKQPVQRGDLIVTSETPGCGMKGSIDSFERMGTVIGKALGSLDQGVGVIPVIITRF